MKCIKSKQDQLVSILFRIISITTLIFEEPPTIVAKK